jgi:hypothetical protein
MKSREENSLEPEVIMDLLHRQDAVFGRLEDLSARQESLVTDENMEPLLDLLGDRRRLSAELADITRELAHARRHWTSVRLCLAPDLREAADGLIHRAGRRLHWLMQRDEEDARKLSIRKQAVTRTLRATGSASDALNAYRSGEERANRLDCTDAMS